MTVSEAKLMLVPPRVMSEMQRRRGEPGDGHGCTAAEVLRQRERELMAQLHDLLFPPAPAPSGGVGASSWSSSSGLNNYDVVAADLAEDDECSPVMSSKVPPAAREEPAGGRRGRHSGSKRPVRDVDEQDGEEGRGGGGASATVKPAARRRKRKQGATTLVTTVPDFDGYQWRKYGQKHIESAKHTRSYYRCTNSTEQGCPAKRTVQRNDDDGGGPPKYTVVYISEHTCKMTESALEPPVILETTVRAPAGASPGIAVVDVPAAESSTNTGTTGSADVSPANSDITWSGGGGGDTNTILSGHGDFSHVFAGDDWEHPTAALQQEMEFAGPIRSPVHVVAAEYGNWSYGLFVNELSSVPSSCHLFGF